MGRWAPPALMFFFSVALPAIWTSASACSLSPLTAASLALTTF